MAKKLPILFACPVCTKLFQSQKEAEACRDQIRDDGGWKIGEELLIPQKTFYGPFQKRTAWKAFDEPIWPGSTSHFDYRKKRHNWWVVIGRYIDQRDPHRPLIVVYTEIDGVGVLGWNQADGDGHNGLYRAGQLDGQTAKSCSIHDRKSKDNGLEFLRKKILTAKPPAGLKNRRSVKQMIEKVATGSLEIHLL